MYLQGSKDSQFAPKQYFTDKPWYTIATNATKRWGKSADPIKENVITYFQLQEDNTVAYLRASFYNGKHIQDGDKHGVLTPTRYPNIYELSVAGSSKTETFFIFATDYDNFSVVTDGAKTYWIMSRTPDICGATLGKLNELLKSYGFNTAQVTALSVIKECSQK